jgi:hypothetical protein
VWIEREDGYAGEADHHVESGVIDVHVERELIDARH